MYGASPAIWDHTVFLTPNTGECAHLYLARQDGRYSIYLFQRDGRLSVLDVLCELDMIT